MPVYKSKGDTHYRIQFRLNNKTFVKSSKTSDKRIAERMEAEWKAQIHAQQFLGQREEITVRQLLDNYLKASLAPATLKHARVFINVLQRRQADRNRRTDARAREHAGRQSLRHG